MYSGISTRLYLLEGTVSTALNSARNSGKHKHLNAEIMNTMDVKNRKTLNTALSETQLAGFTLVRTDNPKVIKYYFTYTDTNTNTNRAQLISYCNVPVACSSVLKLVIEIFTK